MTNVMYKNPSMFLKASYKYFMIILSGISNPAIFALRFAYLGRSEPDDWSNRWGKVDFIAVSKSMLALMDLDIWFSDPFT